MKKLLVTSLVAAIMIGCGSDSSRDSTTTSTTTTPSTTITGQFVDAPVKGIIYKSLSYNGVTDENGNYQCKMGEIVSFYVGGVKLGDTICNTLTSPINLAQGYTTTAMNMAYFLQNLDEDENISNGITVPENVPSLAVDFTDQTTVDEALATIGKTPKITPDEAYQNLRNYMLATQHGINYVPPTDLNLTDEQKYALAYM